MAEEKWHAVGKRKTAIARVWLKPGTGKIVINKNMPPEEYFDRITSLIKIKQPLAITNMQNKFDIYINVKGSGKSAQAEAIRHGVARALVVYDENLKSTLKKAGFLTRDARMVERKKYGKHKARRSHQFSKR